MEVVKEKYIDMTFELIDIGEGFLYNNMIYIRTVTSYDDKVNCVNLENGNFGYLNAYDKVQSPKSIKVVVE